MSDEIAIAVKGVHKSFKLPHEQHNGIKQAIVNFSKRRKGFENQHVLKGVSFDVKKGEFFGIVGRNGSGKSTLLKLLSGIYTPDKGQIQVNGSVTPFIELGVGFNPELTGRENVYMNGAMLGFSNKQMDDMYDEIVGFAELERFMDQKLKNYSSGMQVRLAFSIAIRANTDILILDEVLAVGDAAFQQKCFDYFNNLKKMKKTVILVTHDMNAVQRFCNRAILVHDGEVKKIGKVNEIAHLYNGLNLQSSAKTNAKKGANSEQGKVISKEEYLEKFGTGEADITFRTLDENGVECRGYEPNEKIVIRAKVRANKSLVDPRIGAVIRDATGASVFATNTLVEEINVPVLNEGHEVEMDIVIKNIFTDGTYTVSGAVASNHDETVYVRVEEVCSFVSGGWAMKHALVHPSHDIVITELKT